jgi:hypothetical protein
MNSLCPLYTGCTWLSLQYFLFWLVELNSKIKDAMKSDNPYIGKSIALLVWNTEVENDAHVYLGRIKKEEEDFVFVNDEKGWRISLDNIKLDRLKSVTSELKEMFLNADCVISLSMRGLPDEPGRDFNPTGIRWH